MPVDRVDAARAEERNQVEGAAGGPAVSGEVSQHLVSSEVALIDRLVDPDQVLPDHPSRPEIEVPDLAVPHLTLGEADPEAARLEKGAGGVSRPEPMPHRGLRQFDGVSFPLLPVSPPIKDEQDDRVAVVLV